MNTPDYINVLDYGATGNGAGDDTAAIKAAVAAVRANTVTGSWESIGLYFPPGRVYTCSSPIDFTGVKTIKCEGWLAYRGNVTAPCFIVRGPSKQAGGNYYFYGLYSMTVPYNHMRYPLIRFSGLRGARVQIGACNSYVEVFGDSTDTTYASTAWSEFHLGQTWRLEIHDNADSRNAWVNSNQFYGGALAQLRIGGPWRNITNVVDNGSGLCRVSCANHGYQTGNMVECYNVGGAVAANGIWLVTVIDANTFDLQGTAFSGTYTRGTGQCMGPPGYPHNDNAFYSTDIEDTNAVVHIQGDFNRVIGSRCEATGNSILAFGPGTYGNIFEQVGMTHGVKSLFAPIDMRVKDFGVGNFAGFQHWKFWDRTTIVQSWTPTTQWQSPSIKVQGGEVIYLTCPSNVWKPSLQEFDAKNNPVTTGAIQRFDNAGSCTLIIGYGAGPNVQLTVSSADGNPLPQFAAYHYTQKGPR
jgi:hypothetical protein